jgi:hypothetical protein
MFDMSVFPCLLVCLTLSFWQSFCLFVPPQVRTSNLLNAAHT